MKFSHRFLGCFVLLVLTASVLAKVGDKVPPIVGIRGSGKKVNVQASLKQGPVALYFIKDGCPINDNVAKCYERVGKAFAKTKLTYIAVFDGDKTALKNWNAGRGTNLDALLDPQRKVIDGLKVLRSPTVLIIGQDGRIAEEFLTVSKPELQTLTKSLAVHAKVKAPTLAFADAPNDKTYG